MDSRGVSSANPCQTGRSGNEPDGLPGERRQAQQEGLEQQRLVGVADQTLGGGGDGVDGGGVGGAVGGVGGQVVAIGGGQGGEPEAQLGGAVAAERPLVLLGQRLAPA